jgi:hypothetical protein
VASLTITPEAQRENARIDIHAAPGTAVTFTLTRSGPSGVEAAVRGAVGAPLEGDPTTVRDWEVPFNVPLTYTVTFYNAGGNVVGVGASANYTHTYTGCPAWIVDLARPLNTLPLTIESFSPLDFEVPAGVVRVLDRRAPVVITLPAWTPDAELVLLTNTLAERDALRALLGSGYPFLVRTVPEQGIGNIYLGVTDFKEERLATLGTAPWRRFTIAVVQVERPDPAVFTPIPPTTYATVAEMFTDYAELLATVGTYDALAYWTFTGAPTATRPWLPVDV